MTYRHVCENCSEPSDYDGLHDGLCTQCREEREELEYREAARRHTKYHTAELLIEVLNCHPKKVA